MAPTVVPDVAPILTRERIVSAGVRPHRSLNGLTLSIIVVMVVLVALGVWRGAQKSVVAEEKVRVVAAGKDIQAGCRLGFTSLHYVDIPRRYFQPDMVKSHELVVGRVVKSFIATGEPILSSWLFPGGTGLSLNLETQERAITLTLSEDALVDHSICPGDRVDVLVTLTSCGKKYTKTICQAVTVLMSCPKEALMSSKMRTGVHNRITLAVLPEQAEKLTEASETGKLRLVLRNRLSSTYSVLTGSDEEDLLPNSALAVEHRELRLPPLSVVTAPPPTMAVPSVEPHQMLEPLTKPLQWVVEVFTGSHKETYAFPQKPQ